MKVVYKPTKQSNAIGLASLGFAILFTTVGLYKWKIGPFLRQRQRMQDEEWADFIFEREQKAIGERDQH
jgi:hypothetical protein